MSIEIQIYFKTKNKLVGYVKINIIKKLILRKTNAINIK